MKKIKKYVKMIDEEIEGAECYAELYIESKVDGNADMVSKYHEMAEDEIKHATYLHNWVVNEIERMSKIFTPPAEMMNKWDAEHTKYVNKMNWVKEMLAM